MSRVINSFITTFSIMTIMTVFIFLGVPLSARTLSSQSTNTATPFSIVEVASAPEALSVSVNGDVYQKLKDGGRIQTMSVPLSREVEIVLELERFEVVTQIGRASCRERV